MTTISISLRRAAASIDIGNHILALAQRFVNPIALILVPDCVPPFLADGFRAYMTALLTPYGHWA